MAAGARIVALGGSDDSNTRPSLARDYVAAAREQGLDAHFILLDGVGHKINHWFLAKDGLTEAMNIVLAPR